jgi:lysophospholipase L1-like esterase
VADSPTADPIRQEVNRWIRTSGAFDVVVDLDALVRDDDPRFIRGEPGELTFDGLHYTPEAYRMIAEEIFAHLFRGNGKHLF